MRPAVRPVHFWLLFHLLYFVTLARISHRGNTVSYINKASILCRQSQSAPNQQRKISTRLLYFFSGRIWERCNVSGPPVSRIKPNRQIIPVYLHSQVSNQIF